MDHVTTSETPAHISILALGAPVSWLSTAGPNSAGPFWVLVLAPRWYCSLFRLGPLPFPCFGQSCLGYIFLVEVCHLQKEAPSALAGIRPIMCQMSRPSPAAHPP